MKYYNYELTDNRHSLYSNIANFKVDKGTPKNFGVKMLNHKRKRK